MRPVTADAKITISRCDSAVLVAGGEIGEKRQGEGTGASRRQQAKLGGQVNVADAAVAESTLVEPAVDEAGAIASLPPNFVEGDHGAQFPAIRQAISDRRAQLVVVIAVILVSACRRACEGAGRGRHQAPVLDV